MGVKPPTVRSVSAALTRAGHVKAVAGGRAQGYKVTTAGFAARQRGPGEVVVSWWGMLHGEARHELVMVTAYAETLRAAGWRAEVDPKIRAVRVWTPRPTTEEESR